MTVNSYNFINLHISYTFIRILQFIFICKYSFYNEYIQSFLDFGDQTQSGPQFGSYFHPDFAHYQLFGQMILTYKHLYLILLHLV